jgi:hypothetical protein
MNYIEQAHEEEIFWGKKPIFYDIYFTAYKLPN